MYKAFSNNPKVLENYSLLQEIGVFREIDSHSKRISELELLLKQATEIFSKTNLQSLLDYVIDSISDNFIPGKLIFILQDRNALPRFYGYKNLRPHNFHVDLESLNHFEDFFIKYPRTIHFELFEYQFKHPEITDSFKTIEPEIIVPIVGLNGLYGIILISSKILENHYTDEEIHYIDRLMNFTSISIQNNIHYLSAVTDSKTHLYNHIFFMKRLNEEIEIAENYSVGLGLIVLDIDHFKLFNDNYGHLAGDMVIKKIASVMNHSLRRSDVAARFGGEEFTLLLPNTNRQQTWWIAERLRNSIADQKLNYEGHSLSVTASLGCSSIHTLNRVDAEELIRQADTALYKSKSGGRNRTTVFRPGLLVSATIIRDVQELELESITDKRHSQDVIESTSYSEEQPF